MIFATIEQIDEIYKIFRHYKEIFPHIRKDKLFEMIEKGNVIYQNDVVITFQKYKKTVNLGNIKIPKGSYIIHQIVTKYQGEGKARKILNDFIDFTEGNIYLSVRKNNYRAIRFYEKNGFKAISNISWKNKTIDGYVMVNHILDRI